MAFNAQLRVVLCHTITVKSTKQVTLRLNVTVSPTTQVSGRHNITVKSIAQVIWRLTITVKHTTEVTWRLTIIVKSTTTNHPALTCTVKSLSKVTMCFTHRVNFIGFLSLLRTIKSKNDAQEQSFGKYSVKFSDSQLLMLHLFLWAYL